MAATTIHSLLIKLGFDTSTLSPGIAVIRSELERLQASSAKTAASFVPASLALADFAAASKEVAGSRDAPQALNNMASAVRTMTASLQGTLPAVQATVSSFGALAERVASVTHSGTSLQVLTQGIQTVTGAAKGNTQAVELWLQQVNAAVSMFGKTDPQRLNTFMAESARQFQLNSNAAATYSRYLEQLAKAQILAANAARIQQEADAKAYAGYMKQQMLAQIIAQTDQDVRAKRAASVLTNYQNTTLVPGTSFTADEMAERTRKSVRALGDEMVATASKATFFQRVLSMAFAFSGGVAVTNIISFIGTALVGFNSQLQQSQIAFENLLGSAGAAKDFIAQMEEFANITPFNFQGLNDDVQKLMAMGFAGNEVLPILRAIGDTVAGLGGSQDKLDRIAIALGQIKTAGRVTSQDMRQLTEAGVPAWEMLANAIGKTQAQTRKLAEAGLLPANQALRAIISGMNDRFGDMMARQARTALGAWTTIRDITVQSVANAIQPAFDAVAAVMLSLADFLNNGGGRLIAPTIWAIGVALMVGLIPQLYAAATAVGAFAITIGAGATALKVEILPLIVMVNVLGLAWQENWLGIQSIVLPVVQNLAGMLGSLASSMSFLRPLIEPLAIIVATKFVISLVASAAAATYSAIANRVLAESYTQLTLDTVVQSAATSRLSIVQGINAATATASAAGLGRVGVAAAGARAGISGLLTVAGGLLGVFTAWAIVIVLVVTQTDQIIRGVLGLTAAFALLKVKILEVLASAPLIGGAFQLALDPARADFAALLQQYDELDAKIKAKEAADAANGGGTISPADLKAQIDAQYKAMLDSLGQTQGAVDGAAQDLVKVFGMTLEGVVTAASAAGADAMSQMAKAIDDSRHQPVQALFDLIQAMKTPMTEQQQIARAYGILESSQLAAGLVSGDPAVRAAAEALKKSVTDQLDLLTNGAFSAGSEAALTYAQAYAQAAANAPFASPDALDRNAKSIMAAQATAQAKWKSMMPDANALKDAEKGINAELKTMSDAANKAGQDLSSSFREIQSAAEEYFREVHQGNLQAIDDTLKHKNALLDLKMAMNQGPVDAAQRALDARRHQIEEWRLREAVRTATDPAGQRDAILALNDFLAQSHIDSMQGEVDLAAKKIKAQQKANEDTAQTQRDAENKRYEFMQRDFERQLQLLQDYLSKHPGEWQHTEEKVLALLHGYGFDYRTAGRLLGNSYVLGLRDKLKEAQDVAKQLANAGKPATLNIDTGAGVPIVNPYTGFTTGVSGSPMVSPYSGQVVGSYAEGNWDILHDNLLAYLHKGEAVVPAASAPLIRQLGKEKIPMSAFGAVGSMNTSSIPGTPVVHHTTVYIGDTKMGEAVDGAMYREDRSYGGGPENVQHVGGSVR